MTGTEFQTTTQTLSSTGVIFTCVNIIIKYVVIMCFILHSFVQLESADTKGLNTYNNGTHSIVHVTCIV